MAIVTCGPCLECGVDIPPVVRYSGGSSPGFCSDGCRKARKKTTYPIWLAKNREWQRQQKAVDRAKRKETNPDQFKKFYQANKEKRKAQANAWYHANQERALQQQKEYAAKRLAEDPATMRAQGRRSRSKRRALTLKAFVENVDPVRVFERDKGICGICRKLVERNGRWEVDHVIPLSKGGAHSYDNAQLTHRRCNRSKGAKLPSGQPSFFQVVNS